MRKVAGYSVGQMASLTGLSRDQYTSYESGREDLPFSFIHKCAQIFGLGMTDLLEGHSANLTSYSVTRRGDGRTTTDKDGILIQNMAPLFKKKLAEPYWVNYEYKDSLQNQPISLVTHAGQEFDLILSGALKIQVGDKTEILHEGDSIYYNSSTPHGMIAVEGSDCLFLAMVISGEDLPERFVITEPSAPEKEVERLVVSQFVETVEDNDGRLEKIYFKNEDLFNFAFDVVDELGRRKPEETALVHLDRNMNEHRFTFKDMKDLSSQAANYFQSLGIKRGDRVMLVLRRTYQFWIAILGLHKLGAVAVPATDLLMKHDFDYRFTAGEIAAVMCTSFGDSSHQADLAAPDAPRLRLKIMVDGAREGWHDFDKDFKLFSRRFVREPDAPCGDDNMLMFFTSGTTGNPKMAMHSYKYALGHFTTAWYWHHSRPGGLHFTISDTGWGKALWGKLYGQWMSEGSIFVYDFERFDAKKILPLFEKYNIETFCAPPTMYRMLLLEDFSQYNLTSIRHATTAGEALNIEVYRQFEQRTGLRIAEGFGQTETTLSIGNLIGQAHKPGSMGKPLPLYDIDLVDKDGKSVAVGESGEIVVRTDERIPCGLFLGYYNDEEKTSEVWYDGMYHTGDVAWRDEDGYFWYVSRIDDVIKSSGYRIGPSEIESVVMEIPYVFECGVSSVPDELRGQIVKASVVLKEGVVPSEALKKEIQEYVKKNTAPYKYPRIVVFRDSLPKTISGKVIRNQL
jgi:acetyl-CoA synthetase